MDDEPISGPGDERLRLFAYVRRHQDLSHEQFLEHWRGVHGPLIAGTPGLAEHIVRYEQFAVRPGDPSGFDGVAVQEFAAFDDFLAMIGGEAGEAMRADERRFLDTSATSYLFTVDRVTVVDRSDLDHRAEPPDPQ